MDLTSHEKAFRDFANGHLTGDHTHDYHIILKREHSMRVLDNARAIIHGQRLTGRTADLAEMSALYHDIGRFPQYARYGTFKDADSVNHGRQGLLTLRDTPLPDGITDADWRLIRAAVGLHNTKELNPRTPQPLKDIVNVVRDADKLDIYAVILDHLATESDDMDVVILSLEYDPMKYSDAILDRVLAEQPCEYGMLKYTNDFILLLVGWLFSFAYPTTIRLLAERKLVDKAFSILPESEKVQALEKKANEFIHYKMAGTP